MQLAVTAPRQRPQMLDALGAATTADGQQSLSDHTSLAGISCLFKHFDEICRLLILADDCDCPDSRTTDTGIRILEARYYYRQCLADLSLAGQLN